jgi:acyl carrier protein
MQERDAMSVLDHLREMAATAFGVDLRRVHADSTWQDLGADMLDVVSFFIEVEETYGLEISENDEQDIKTISGLAEFVERRKTKVPA